jgi:hypothetical protein
MKILVHDSLTLKDWSMLLSKHSEELRSKIMLFMASAKSMIRQRITKSVVKMKKRVEILRKGREAHS